MGNLYDYFRAPDGRTVVALMEATDGAGPAAPVSGTPRPDAVDAEGIDSGVILGKPAPAWAARRRVRRADYSVLRVYRILSR